MMIQLKLQKFKLNQKGQLTLDFLFGCILVIGVSAILGAITFALTLTEVLQYVSFSGARNYFAGDLNKQTQSDMASGKVKFLLAKLPFLSGAQQAGWLTVTGGKADNFSDIGNGYSSSIGADDDKSTIRRDQFTGYQITFKLPILNIKIPLIGSVMQPPDGGDSFHGTVSSFLMREPATDECMKYNQSIYDTIRKNYSQAPPGGFVSINDNGC